MDMNEIVDIVHDAEASGLLDDSTVDYTASPWKLKDTFKMHIVSVQEFPSGEFIAFYDGPKIILDGRKHVTVIDGIEYRLEDYEPVEYRHFPLAKFKDYVKKRKIRKAIAHNGIGYDLLAYKAYFGLNYTIQEEGDTWADKDVEHVDTMVLSKTLNPDRQGGHNLENVAKAAGGVQKKEFRYHMPSDERFKHFAADMLHYNLFDLKSNKSVYDYLMKEKGNHDWSNAITTEKCIADLITRQAHRGFAFNVELAEKNVKELDAMMQEARIKVEPILPPKQATKGFMKDFTPPKNQYKKDGSLSHHMEKFIEKLQAKKIETEGKVSAIEFQGKVYQLPLEEGKSLVTEVPATLDDTTHIKEWLVSLGWSPSEYKEKDLTLKTGTKIKLTPEEYAKVVDKYVEQTLNSSFMEDRCEFLECTPRTLKTKLLSVKNGRGMRVRTNPSFTKGQDKEMCANLEAMGEKFPFATDIVKYLTYKHRRNSILGGGADWDDDEDAEKGFISAVRADGRIPTPADTCGAATSRMKHRLVANISRVTSLYGEPMRSMFTADPENCYQIGYDFASLEAVIESHYCHKYETPTEKGVREYCESLLQEKPNDVHCYSEDTEILTANGWKTFGEITFQDRVAQWENGVIDYVTPEDIVWQDYTGAMVQIKNQAIDKLITPNHRVLTADPRRNTNKIREAREFINLSSQFAIPTAGVYSRGKKDSPFVRLLVAIQADGCFAKDCSAVVFTFVKERKYERLIKLLKELDVAYSTRSFIRKGRRELNVRILSGSFTENIRATLGSNKELPFNLITEGYAETIVEETKFWDGTERSKSTSVLDTTSLHTRDFLQACAVVSGYNAYCQTYENKKGCYGECTIYRCLVNESTNSKTFKANLDVSEVQYSGKIGCVSVPSGLIVVRRNGKACISGNTKMAEKISNIIERKFERSNAKSVKYGCTYGAQAAKVAKTIGSDLKVGQQVFDAFWEAAAPLKKLKDALQKHWESNDKRYILTIDNRKVPTRAAHAILNSLFQSAGVICAKKTMIIWERKLRENGLAVDFWTEDWKNKLWAQQMIAYHDEAQIEVSKKLVKFKMFSTKEEVNAFRKEQYESQGLIWAEAHESPKGGWFTAYSLPGQLVVEAVKETTEFYKLNCPLSADYVLGTSWANCH